MFDEPIIHLRPVGFFALSWDCDRLKSWDESLNPKKHQLPSTHYLTAEESFATVCMGWHEEGLKVMIAVNVPSQKVVFPDIQQGDSIELFIDTRDVKTTGVNTKFCHHFYFLPEAFESHLCGEITRFRTDDQHERCDSELLVCKPKKTREGYKIELEIPSQCLFGYDPSQFKRIGFNYRINRTNAPSQHFSVASAEYSVDQQPALWSSVRLNS